MTTENLISTTVSGIGRYNQKAVANVQETEEFLIVTALDYGRPDAYIEALYTYLNYAQNYFENPAKKHKPIILDLLACNGFGSHRLFLVDLFTAGSCSLQVTNLVTVKTINEDVKAKAEMQANDQFLELVKYKKIDILQTTLPEAMKRTQSLVAYKMKLSPQFVGS